MVYYTFLLVISRFVRRLISDRIFNILKTYLGFIILKILKKICKIVLLLDLKLFFVTVLFIISIINVIFSVLLDLTALLIIFLFFTILIFCVIYSSLVNYEIDVSEVSKIWNNIKDFVKKLDIKVYFYVCFLFFVFIVISWYSFYQIITYYDILNFLNLYFFPVISLLVKVKWFSRSVLSNLSLSMFLVRRSGDTVERCRNIGKSYSFCTSTVDDKFIWNFYKPIEKFYKNMESNQDVFVEFSDGNDTRIRCNGCTLNDYNSYDFITDDKIMIDRLWLNNYGDCKVVFEGNKGNFRKYLEQDNRIIRSHPATVVCRNNHVLMIPHTSYKKESIFGFDMSSLKFREVKLSTKSFFGINSYNSGKSQEFFSNIIKFNYMKYRFTTIDASSIPKNLEPLIGLQLSEFKRNEEFY